MIIHTLNRILRKKLGENKFFINCLVTPAERADNNLVDEKYLYGETGNWEDSENAYLILSPYNVVELFGMFDWVF
jgi:hypothetical protein